MILVAQLLDLILAQLFKWLFQPLMALLGDVRG